MSRLCRHRIKLGDKESYYYISPSSRARVIITFSVAFVRGYCYCCDVLLLVTLSSFQLSRSQQFAIFLLTSATSCKAWWDTMVSSYTYLFKILCNSFLSFRFFYSAFVCLVSLSSGADVLGGNASPQRDDCGQVGFLPHWPELEDLTVPSNTWQDGRISGSWLFRKVCVKLWWQIRVGSVFAAVLRPSNKESRRYSSAVRQNWTSTARRK